MNFDKKKKIDLEEYKRILVTMLVKIDKLCDENDLTYQLAYGTLLGAVRHNGFIPWDDDVDIFMPRADYLKLQKIIQHGNYGINFIDINTEPKTIYPYGKICDIRTILYEKNFKMVPGYGAYIDVFPLDYITENKIKRKIKFWKYSIMRKVIEHSAKTKYSRDKSISKTLLKMLAFYICRFVNTQKVIRKLDNELQQNKESNLLAVPWDNNGNGFYKNDIYQNQKVKFETAFLYISKNYDSILTKMYGNYMQLPPKNQRINKHNLYCWYR